MKENDTSFLANEKIGRLMRQYAVPCIISLLVGALYNIVDQIFIANAKDLGSFGNAANTVVFPLTVIALAVAVMIGDGCCAFVSISQGAGQGENVRRGVGSAILLAILSGLFLTAVYLLFPKPILTAFGGTVNDETFRFAKEYFFYISLGIPFYVFGQAMNPVIRADGSPRFAMISTLAGAVLNIILDPIFIFVFHWGMMGGGCGNRAGADCHCRACRMVSLSHQNRALYGKGPAPLPSCDTPDACARYLQFPFPAFSGAGNGGNQ